MELSDDRLSPEEDTISQRYKIVNSIMKRNKKNSNFCISKAKVTLPPKGELCEHCNVYFNSSQAVIDHLKEVINSYQTDRAQSERKKQRYSDNESVTHMRESNTSEIVEDRNQTSCDAAEILGISEEKAQDSIEEPSRKKIRLNEKFKYHGATSSSVNDNPESLDNICAKVNEASVTQISKRPVKRIPVVKLDKMELPNSCKETFLNNYKTIVHGFNRHPSPQSQRLFVKKNVPDDFMNATASARHDRYLQRSVKKLENTEFGTLQKQKISEDKGKKKDMRTLFADKLLTSSESNKKADYFAGKSKFTQFETGRKHTFNEKDKLVSAIKRGPFYKLREKASFRLEHDNNSDVLSDKLSNKIDLNKRETFSNKISNKLLNYKMERFLQSKGENYDLSAKGTMISEALSTKPDETETLHSDEGIQITRVTVPLYRCDICDIHFASFKSIKKHSRICDGDNRAQTMCRDCNLQFHNSEIKTHTEHHLKILNCKFDIRPVVNLRRHREVKGDLKSNKISEDLTETIHVLDSKSTSQHMLYKCSICSLHLLTREALQVHISIADHGPEAKTRCEHCKLTFLTNSLAKHTKLHHDILKLKRKDFHIITDNHESNVFRVPVDKESNINTDTELDDTDFYESHISDNSNFISLKEHRNTKHISSNNSQQLSCFGKGKDAAAIPVFNTTSVKRNMHFDEYNDILYKCNICSLHFNNAKTLQVHTSNGVHNIKTRTKCPICGLAFSKISLKRHQHVHHDKLGLKKNDFRITSNYLNNPQSGQYERNVSEDRNTAIAKMPIRLLDNRYPARNLEDKALKKTLYRCQVCSLSFVTPRGLQVHLAADIHDMERKQCAECGYMFTPTSLAHHQQLHHDSLKIKKEHFVIKDTVNIRYRGFKLVDTNVDGKELAQKETSGTHLSDETVNIEEHPSNCQDITKYNSNSKRKTDDDVKLKSHNHKNVEFEKPSKTTITNSNNSDSNDDIIGISKDVTSDQVVYKRTTKDLIKRKRSVDEFNESSLQSTDTCEFNTTDDENSISDCSDLGKKSKQGIKNEHNSYLVTVDKQSTCKPHRIKLFKCSECGVNFLSQNTCLYHVYKHVPLHPKDYTECIECGLTFKYRSLQIHRKKQHDGHYKLEDVLIEEYDPNAKIIRRYFAKDSSQSIDVPRVKDTEVSSESLIIDKDTAVDVTQQTENEKGIQSLPAKEDFGTSNKNNERTGNVTETLKSKGAEGTGASIKILEFTKPIINKDTGQSSKAQKSRPGLNTCRECNGYILFKPSHLGTINSLDLCKKCDQQSKNDIQKQSNISESSVVSTEAGLDVQNTFITNTEASNVSNRIDNNLEENYELIKVLSGVDDYIASAIGETVKIPFEKDSQETVEDPTIHATVNKHVDANFKSITDPDRKVIELNDTTMELSKRDDSMEFSGGFSDAESNSGTVERLLDTLFNKDSWDANETEVNTDPNTNRIAEGLDIPQIPFKDNMAIDTLEESDQAIVCEQQNKRSQCDTLSEITDTIDKTVTNDTIDVQDKMLIISELNTVSKCISELNTAANKDIANITTHNKQNESRHIHNNPVKNNNEKQNSAASTSTEVNVLNICTHLTDCTVKSEKESPDNHQKEGTESLGDSQGSRINDKETIELKHVNTESIAVSKQTNANELDDKKSIPKIGGNTVVLIESDDSDCEIIYMGPRKIPKLKSSTEIQNCDKYCIEIGESDSETDLVDTKHCATDNGKETRNNSPESFKDNAGPKFTENSKFTNIVTKVNNDIVINLTNTIKSEMGNEATDNSEERTNNSPESVKDSKFAENSKFTNIVSKVNNDIVNLKRTIKSEVDNEVVLKVDLKHVDANFKSITDPHRKVIELNDTRKELSKRDDSIEFGFSDTESNSGTVERLLDTVVNKDSWDANETEVNTETNTNRIAEGLDIPQIPFKDNMATDTLEESDQAIVGEQQNKRSQCDTLSEITETTDKTVTNDTIDVQDKMLIISELNTAANKDIANITTHNKQNESRHIHNNPVKNNNEKQNSAASTSTEVNTLNICTHQTDCTVKSEKESPDNHQKECTESLGDSQGSRINDKETIELKRVNPQSIAVSKQTNANELDDKKNIPKIGENTVVLIESDDSDCEIIYMGPRKIPKLKSSTEIQNCDKDCIEIGESDSETDLVDTKHCATDNGEETRNNSPESFKDNAGPKFTENSKFTNIVTKVNNDIVINLTNTTKSEMGNEATDNSEERTNNSPESVKDSKFAENSKLTNIVSKVNNDIVYLKRTIKSEVDNEVVLKVDLITDIGKNPISKSTSQNVIKEERKDDVIDSKGHVATEEGRLGLKKEPKCEESTLINKHNDSNDTAKLSSVAKRNGLDSSVIIVDDQSNQNENKDTLRICLDRTGSQNLQVREFIVKIGLSDDTFGNNEKIINIPLKIEAGKENQQVTRLRIQEVDNRGVICRIKNEPPIDGNNKEFKNDMHIRENNHVNVKDTLNKPIKTEPEANNYVNVKDTLNKHIKTEFEANNENVKRVCNKLRQKCDASENVSKISDKESPDVIEINSEDEHDIEYVKDEKKACCSVHVTVNHRPLTP